MASVPARVLCYPPFNQQSSLGHAQTTRRLDDWVSAQIMNEALASARASSSAGRYGDRAFGQGIMQTRAAYWMVKLHVADHLDGPLGPKAITRQ